MICVFGYQPTSVVLFRNLSQIMCGCGTFSKWSMAFRSCQLGRENLVLNPILTFAFKHYINICIYQLNHELTFTFIIFIFVCSFKHYRMNSQFCPTVWKRKSQKLCLLWGTCDNSTHSISYNDKDYAFGWTVHAPSWNTLPFKSASKQLTPHCGVCLLPVLIKPLQSGVEMLTRVINRAKNDEPMKWASLKDLCRAHNNRNRPYP